MTIDFNAGAVNRITHNIKPLTAAYYLIVIINRLSEFLYNIALNLGLIIKKKRRLLKNGETDIDTVFSFNVSMNLNMGSDENNATINLNPDDEQEEGAELNEAE